MPSVSRVERRFMRAAANNAEFAAKAGIKQSVAKEFAAADKGKSDKGLPERKGKTRMEKRGYKHG